MKKMIRFLSVTAVLATAAAAAQAQVYVEGSVTGLTAKDATLGFQSKPSTFSGLVGYTVHPNVDVEGYLAMSAGESDMTFDGANSDFKWKVKSSFGAFVKPKVMVSKELEVFGRIGYLENKFSANTKDRKNTTGATEGSFAYGMGANYYFDKRTYVTGSYMSYHNKDGLKVNGLSVGVGYKF